MTNTTTTLTVETGRISKLTIDKYGHMKLSVIERQTVTIERETAVEVGTPPAYPVALPFPWELPGIATILRLT